VVPCLLVLLVAADDEGYTYPPEQRGDMVARLNVEVPEGSGPPRVYYTLTVEGGPGLEVEPPQLEDSTGAWTALRTSAWMFADGRVLWTEAIVLSQVKPGLVPLPDVKLSFRDSSTGAWQEAEWIDVLKDLREIPGPAPPPQPQAGWRLTSRAGIAGAAVLVVLIVAVVLSKRRRTELPLSPEGRALREVDRIERLMAASANQPEQMFAQLSDLLRSYLTERYGLPAFQQTTAEFVERVSEMSSLAGEIQNLRDIFELCDLAKYAGVAGGRSQWNRAIEQARTFIGRTAPDSQAPIIRAAQTVTNGHPREYD
jgi:hypothetical protein